MQPLGTPAQKFSSCWTSVPPLSTSVQKFLSAFCVGSTVWPTSGEPPDLAMLSVPGGDAFQNHV